MQPSNEEARSGRHRPSLSGDENQEPSPETKQDLDEILTCWRRARSLDHPLNLYRLQFEHDVAGALDTDHHVLTAEIQSSNAVTGGLGAT